MVHAVIEEVQDGAGSDALTLTTLMPLRTLKGFDDRLVHRERRRWPISEIRLAKPKPKDKGF